MAWNQWNPRPKGRGKRDTFYDPTTGKRVGYTVDGSKPLPRRSPKLLPPSKVKRAARACDALAVGLDFARVDLYDAGPAGFLLGELTMYPKRGGHKFNPPGLDVQLGRAWCHPERSARPRPPKAATRGRGSGRPPAPGP